MTNANKAVIVVKRLLTAFVVVLVAWLGLGLRAAGAVRVLDVLVDLLGPVVR